MIRPIEGYKALKASLSHRFQDGRQNPRVKVKHSALPELCVFPNMGMLIPNLRQPLIIISDWQYERLTQLYFYEQLRPMLRDVCGGLPALQGAIILSPGDMISAGDDLRSAASDAEPDLSLFMDMLGPQGWKYQIYGNHDNPVPADRIPTNSNGDPVLLPDAADALVLNCPLGTIAGVHGIPSDRNADGWKKRIRRDYFHALARACTADVVVAHSNPQLPGQTGIRSDGQQDALDAFEMFYKGNARLFVHGHTHAPECVSILDNHKIVVNSDKRIVVLLPGMQLPREILAWVAPEANLLDVTFLRRPFGITAVARDEIAGLGYKADKVNRSDPAKMADRLGVKDGMKLVSVNGQDVQEWAFDQIKALVKDVPLPALFQFQD